MFVYKYIEYYINIGERMLIARSMHDSLYKHSAQLVVLVVVVVVFAVWKTCQLNLTTGVKLWMTKHWMIKLFSG